ncbi:unnamed protein product [Cyprideis torosa]|uniref:Uncharacterized protein n=1 Tax=Cyprideis torosa TaxID=163714 RepID=A0A7R8W662_9CRUS|nr:unnamed protein product [Cyprideis torosa]CAG0883669.1 unnamed protein product [Cyprideis torosa]
MSSPTSYPCAASASSGDLTNSPDSEEKRKPGLLRGFRRFFKRRSAPSGTREKPLTEIQYDKATVPPPARFGASAGSLQTQSRDGLSMSHDSIFTGSPLSLGATENTGHQPHVSPSGPSSLTPVYSSRCHQPSVPIPSHRHPFPYPHGPYFPGGHSGYLASSGVAGPSSLGPGLGLAGPIATGRQIPRPFLGIECVVYLQKPHFDLSCGSIVDSAQLFVDSCGVENGALMMALMSFV